MSVENDVQRPCEVALLTGGADKPYALGLAGALISQGVFFDFIGSDEVNGPALHHASQVNFLNLRGNQQTNASALIKASRVLAYYRRLLCYAATARPKIFHVLWNNKFETFDRTLLMLYYKLLGKRIAFTAHNVNAGQRDHNDTWLNRVSLRTQYRLVDHIFVHTKKMEHELMAQFGVPEAKISVIPFGINNTVPNTRVTSAEAKELLGLGGSHKTMLFFGNIAPYKGLEYLIEALGIIMSKDQDYRLIIAGRPKACPDYWRQIQETIARTATRGRILERIEFIPDEETERYFKAADVLILPYVHIFQSGVLFLSYSFGLPVIASDVGSMKDDIVEGDTGLVCAPRNAADLAQAIQKYFGSDLFRQLERRRSRIQEFANARYSWDKVGEITAQVYARLSGRAAAPMLSANRAGERRG